MRLFASMWAAVVCIVVAAHVAMGQDPAPPKPGSEQAAIEEIEPNNDPKKASQEILPGQVLKGAFSDKDDVDCVLLAVEGAVIIDLTWSLQDNINGRMQFAAASGKNLYARNGPLRANGVRLQAGKHLIRMNNESDAGATWELVTTVVKEVDHVEYEPNDRAEQAQEIALGALIKGTVSHPASDRDYFSARIDSPGLYRLSIARKLRPRDIGTEGVTAPEFDLRMTEKGSRAEGYMYRVDNLAPAYEFFPWIGKGEVLIDIQSKSDTVGAGYEFKLEPFQARASGDLEAKARAAIKRGEDWLLRANVDKPQTYEAAARAFQLMALCEGEWDDRKAARDARVAELLEWMGGAFKLDNKGTWRGDPVFSLGGMYEHAMCTLALAEAVAAGFEKARQPCVKAVRYLLAAQLSEERCAAWGPVESSLEDHGGWRYSGSSKDADLSVTGWCVVALYAADAAGVKEPGVNAAVRRAQACVKRCTYKTEGFTYSPSNAASGLIRQSIGTLIYLLLGMDGAELKIAQDEIDRHQCAATQSPVSTHDCPFYYWYYATRAVYLRGGTPWESWRTVTMHQLTRTQLADGSWASIRQEEPTGARYATGMAVVVLRLCLNKPPSYLRKEVKGF